jgi:hypothetical protein
MILKAILFSMVVASASFFITHSQLTWPFRKWLNKVKRDWPGGVFFNDLFDCPYCLGHWFTAALLLVFPMRLFGIFAPVDYLFTWTVISWAAGLQSLAMSQLLGE